MPVDLGRYRSNGRSRDHLDVQQAPLGQSATDHRPVGRGLELVDIVLGDDQQDRVPRLPTPARAVGRVSAAPAPRHRPATLVGHRCVLDGEGHGKGRHGTIGRRRGSIVPWSISATQPVIPGLMAHTARGWSRRPPSMAWYPPEDSPMKTSGPCVRIAERGGHVDDVVDGLGRLRSCSGPGRGGRTSPPARRSRCGGSGSPRPANRRASSTQHRPGPTWSRAPEDRNITVGPSSGGRGRARLGDHPEQRVRPEPHRPLGDGPSSVWPTTPVSTGSKCNGLAGPSTTDVAQPTMALMEVAGQGDHLRGDVEQAGRAPRSRSSRPRWPRTGPGSPHAVLVGPGQHRGRHRARHQRGQRRAATGLHHRRASR